MQAPESPPVEHDEAAAPAPDLQAEHPLYREAILKVEGLVKSYGGNRALNGLSLSVPAGSIYGFVGPNGAGKTTTMRILSTLLEADGGSAWIAGENVRTHPGRVRARIGFMPDFFGVYDDLTVREYLEFYAASYGVPAGKRRTTNAELLELVDLAHKRDEYVESLSRGMKQRLGLARCLVHDPEVLLLDEPASGMDPRARIEMREIVKELRRIGKTVLVSSHILLELSEMCTHVGIVQAGRLLREGSVEHVLRGITADRAVEVRVLGDPEPAMALVKGHPGVNDVLPPNEIHRAADPEFLLPATFVLHTHCDDQGLSELLRLMVDGGTRVVGFAPQRDNLEEVFMQLTSEHDE